jgi:signal peptidase I
MTPTLIPGDCILVEKWTLGGRIFDIYEAAAGKDVEIKRLPALGKIERNDVLVFNFPYPKSWDSLGLDVRKYYVKRCAALPGDTFSIEDVRNQISGYDKSLGNVEGQTDLKYLLERSDEDSLFVSMRAYPLNDSIPWTIKDFGPFYIPKQGASIPMNPHNAILYRNVIEWEQKKSLYIKGDSILLGDSLITDYRFKENYYFTTGDHVMNSQDSRYWGLLPEPFIVGRAIYIWKSVNPVTEKIRWDRIMKRIE